MLDHLSEGRFEFGTGRGSSSHRVQGLRHPRRRHDARDVRRGAAADPAHVEGGRATATRAASSRCRSATCCRSRTRKPHPPIWVACGSPSTFEKAGRLGLGALCFSLGSPKDFEPLIEVYKDAIRHAEPVGDYVNDNVACVTALVCLEDGKAARDVALDMGSGYHTSLVFRYLDTFPRPAGVPAWPQLIPEPTPAQLEERIASGQRIVGDPDECAQAVQQYADVGCDQIIFGVLASTQPQEVALRIGASSSAQQVHPALRQGSGAQHDAHARGGAGKAEQAAAR